VPTLKVTARIWRMKIPASKQQSFDVQAMVVRVTAATDFKTPRKHLASLVVEVEDRYIPGKLEFSELYMDDDANMPKSTI